MPDEVHRGAAVVLQTLAVKQFLRRNNSVMNVSIVQVASLRSQLGAATVSSVPDEVTGEIGGLQNHDEPRRLPPHGSTAFG